MVIAVAEEHNESISINSVKVDSFPYLQSCIISIINVYVYIIMYIYMFLNERWEGKKKEASKVKQTRQSNTAHPRQSLFLDHMYMYVYIILQYMCIVH